MEFTRNLNLKKPGPDEFININDLNDNADVIDLEVSLIRDKLDSLNTNDKEVRKSVNELKLMLEEKSLIDFINNNTGVGFYELFKSNDEIDTAGTTATIDNVRCRVEFLKSQVIKFKEQEFKDISKVEVKVYDKTINNIPVLAASSTNQVDVLIPPGSKVVGDKVFYDGEEYTITGIEEQI